MYPLLYKDENSKGRFEGAEARRKGWSEINPGRAENAEEETEKVSEESIPGGHHVQGGDKRDLVSDALGESTVQPSTKRARQEREGEEDVVVQGQTGGSSGSASERRNEREEGEDSNAKRQRICNQKQ